MIPIVKIDQINMRVYLKYNKQITYTCCKQSTLHQIGHMLIIYIFE